MKRLLLALALLIALPLTASAQSTQVVFSGVLREQTRLGYHPFNGGVKIEGDYRFSDAWTAVSYVSWLHSPKVDSGTGNSYFASLGARWSPFRWSRVEPFGEVDFVMGALNTVRYRKTVAHFRTGLGVRLLNHRLLVEVSRLYQDLLPDAAKLLKERGNDVSALHTTFNQVSGWDYELQYWYPFAEGSRWGVKSAVRIQRAKFIKNPFGDRGRAWWGQLEAGVYKTF